MRPTLMQILEASLEAFCINSEYYERIKNTRRKDSITIRQCVSLIAQECGHTQTSIGKFLNIDHSTVFHCVSKAKAYMSYDKEYESNIRKARVLCMRFAYLLEGWVARDKEDEHLYFFLDSTENIDGAWYREGGLKYELPKSYFPQVTHEESPRRCELTLRLK